MKGNRNAAVSALCATATLSIAAPAMAQAAGGSLSIVDTPAVAQLSSEYSADTSFTADYHTNVAGGDAATAKARGLQQDDIIFTPSAVVEAFHAIGRESVYVTGTIGYNFYDHNTVLNREHIDLNGGVNGQLGPCRATATGGYARRQQDLQETILTRVQDTYSVSSVGLKGACGRDYGLSPNFSVTQSWANNGSALESTSDYSSIGGSAGLSYSTPTLGVLSLFGQAQSTEFVNRLTIGGQHDGINSYGGGVRYTRELGARIQGAVSFGYTSVRPFLSGTRGFDGPTYSADLTFRANSLLSLHGNFTRDVLPSNVLNSTYNISTTELIEASYKLGSRLSFTLGATATDRSYQGSFLSPTFNLTNNHSDSVYASATYHLRRIYFTLNASNTHRSANVVGLGYVDDRVGLTAGANF